MKLIILAAGSGTRLRPYTEDRPKCMAPVGGRPLIDWLVETAERAGINGIVIVRGYRAENLILSTEAQSLKPEYVLNPDFATTNMVFSLWTARHTFTDPVIISYADILYEPEVLVSLMASPDEISVVVDRSWRNYWENRFDDPLSDAESLAIGDDGNIQSIGQEVTAIDDVEGQYIGLMKFAGKGLEVLVNTLTAAYDGKLQSPRSLEQMYMTDVLQEMINSGEKLQPNWIEGQWLEIDSVKDLEIAEGYLVQGSDHSSDGLKINRPKQPETTP